jgi:hypothetical protein
MRARGRAKQKRGRKGCEGGLKAWAAKAQAQGKHAREERTPTQKAWAGLLIAVSLVIIGAAQRDIQGRSEDEVRGKRLLWRIVSLNALGALAYFLLGRREAATEAAE